ncbi:MAG: lipid II flippase MurJ, partial [Tepidanaerobacteraceae bacterium]
MKKTALLLMIITIVSKIVGFGREITLSYFYGASNISDAFLISLTIPNVIFSFIGVGISTGYIPLYSEIEQKQGGKEGYRYTNNLVNILLIICTGIIFFGYLFTNQIVKVFASGFEGDTLALAVRFTRISLLGIYFTGLI